MPRNDLSSGALLLLLQHQMTGCQRAARQAIDLLDRLDLASDADDAQASSLFRRMRDRLEGELARSGT